MHFYHVNHTVYKFVQCMFTAKILSGLTADQKENAFRSYVLLVAVENKLEHLKWLFQAVVQLVNANVIAAR